MFHEPWTIKVLDEDRFIKLYGDGLEAVTLPEYKVIYLNEEEVTLNTIRHELFHAYYSNLCVSAACLSDRQTEEVAAELFCKHGDTILKQSKYIYAQI